MLEKRANFREATKNLLVFSQEDMEVKEKKAKKKVWFLTGRFSKCQENLSDYFRFRWRNQFNKYLSLLELVTIIRVKDVNQHSSAGHGFSVGSIVS